MDTMQRLVLTVSIIIIVLLTPTIVIFEDFVKNTNFLKYFAIFFFVLGIISGLFSRND
ncbi:MAG: hypothetical protein KatS3mg129_1305 [Leptospiraceae bacterium]|nr:MAG: hypothetical protein KatS3mg129_1305 [Leptospiraceae bacterium]